MESLTRKYYKTCNIEFLKELCSDYDLPDYLQYSNKETIIDYIMEVSLLNLDGYGMTYQEIEYNVKVLLPMNALIIKNPNYYSSHFLKHLKKYKEYALYWNKKGQLNGRLDMSFKHGLSCLKN